MVKLNFSSARVSCLRLARVQHLLKVEGLRHFQSATKITASGKEQLQNLGSVAANLLFSSTFTAFMNLEWRKGVVRSPA